MLERERERENFGCSSSKQSRLGLFASLSWTDSREKILSCVCTFGRGVCRGCLVLWWCYLAGVLVLDGAPMMQEKKILTLNSPFGGKAAVYQWPLSQSVSFFFSCFCLLHSPGAFSLSAFYSLL